MPVERIAEIFSLISLAVLSLVPVFFYLRNRIRRRASRPQPSAPAAEARSQRQGEGAASRPAMRGIQEAPAEPRAEAARRELRLFEEATITRREQARARIAEAQAGAPRRRGGAARGLTGWRRIDALPPLKRAVILSEVLGRPRGLSEESPDNV